MGIKLNLTSDEIKNAQGGGFAPLPEGVYGAVIYETKFGKSKAQNDMYTITFKLLDGQGYDKRRQTAWFALTPKALFKVIELLKATGFEFPSKKWADEHPDEEFEFPDANEFLGIKVNIELIQEPYASVEEDEDPDSDTYGEEIEVTKFRNNVKKVTKFDEEKWAVGEDNSATKSALFL